MMTFMKRPSEEGQTVVEYLLLLLVMTTIITSLLGYIKVRYLGDATKCDNAAMKKTILCRINGILEPDSSGGKRFQTFPFKK